MPPITVMNVLACLLFPFLAAFAWHVGAKVGQRILP
jgi:hypothetical protein